MEGERSVERDPSAQPYKGLFRMNGPDRLAHRGCLLLARIGPDITESIRECQPPAPPTRDLSGHRSPCQNGPGAPRFWHPAPPRRSLPTPRIAPPLRAFYSNFLLRRGRTPLRLLGQLDTGSSFPCAFLGGNFPFGGCSIRGIASDKLYAALR